MYILARENEDNMNKILNKFQKSYYFEARDGHGHRDISGNSRERQISGDG
jgi:hypothetical protein